MLQHRFEHVERARLHAGRADAKACKFQRHHEPRDVHGHRFADGGRMRQHDVALKLFEIVVLDLHAGEFTKTCVDAVDGRAFGQDRGDSLRAGFDGRARGGIKRERGAAIDRAPVGKAHRAGLQNNGGHWPLQMRL